MSDGLRRRWIGMFVVLAGTIAQVARPQNLPADEPAAKFELNVELTWAYTEPIPAISDPSEREHDAPKLGLLVEGGKILEIVPWRADGSGRLIDRSIRPSPTPGKWDLGTERLGRVRAKVEATLGASFVLTRDDQTARVPVAGVVDRPQDSPEESPLRLHVERLPWDSLSVAIGKASRPMKEGATPRDPGEVVAPGAIVPVTVGHRIVSPEGDQVSVRTTLTLRPVRGGAPVWKQEQKDLVPANRLDPVAKVWTVTAPKAEGTYILEVHSAWEAPATAGERDPSPGRIGRLIRRHRGSPNSGHSAHRQVGLVVFDPQATPPKPTPTPASKGQANAAEAEVDSFDLSRVRNGRFAGTGRSERDESKRVAWEIPMAALKNNGRREGLRSWIPTTATDVANLGVADAGSYAWSAAGLKVIHPDRPHRLTVTIAGGDPGTLSVAVVDPGSAGGRPRVVLDACGSGPPILPAGTPASASWIIWPDTLEPTLVLLNRSQDSPLRLAGVRLAELDDLPPAPYVFEPKSSPGRALGLYLGGPEVLDRFGGGGESGFFDVLAAGQHLASYLKSCGATDLVVSEDLADRADRQLLQGQAIEDSTSPDRLDLLLMVLRRHGCRAWLEVDFESPEALAGLPPIDSAEALERGLVRIDRAGQPDGAAYHPLHADVREAMKAKVTGAISRRKNRPALNGLLIRLGSGPTLLGTADTGMDDATYERFVRETFGSDVARGIPGLDKADADRFAARLRYLSGVGRVPWLTWRSKAIASLYTDLTKAVHDASPGAQLALMTPTLDDGPAGSEARRVDLSGLSPAHAWRSVGLDFQVWPNGPDSPIIVRGTGLSTEDLARDLATNSDLDSKVASRTRRGMMLVLDDDFPSTTIGFNAPLPPLPGGSAELGAETNLAPIRPFRSSSRDSATSTGSGLWMKCLPLPDGPAGDEVLGHSLASLDSHYCFISSEIASGNEERLRRFATVLRALPASPVEVSSSAADMSKLGVTLRTLRADSLTYLEMANDTPYPIRLAVTLNGLDSTTPIDDLGRGIRLAVPPADAERGRLLVMDMPPFGASAIRVGAPGAVVDAVNPHPSQSVLNGMETHYKELSGQLARLNRSLSGGGTVELPSAGFEPAPEPQVQRTARRVPEGAPSGELEVSEIGLPPVGWKVEGVLGTTAIMDGENPHAGQGSAKLVVPEAPASFVSSPFTPNTLTALTIEAFLRSDVPEARVRVWIEAQAEGKPFIRRSELVISPEWRPRAFRADDIPSSGLESARLRFEMLTAGTLWIDDVRIINEQASKSARLNAQRALISALQAYRDKRYADFARLGSSHWTKHPGVLASIRPHRSSPIASSASSDHPRTDPAAASALPADRAVR